MPDNRILLKEMQPLSAAYGVSIAMALLFASAAVHKLVQVRVGQVANDPLIARRPWTARRAPAVVVTVAAGEAALAVALVAVPRVGLPASAAVLLFYARELHQVAWDTPCHCFAVTTRATTRTAIRRDLALAAATGAATAAVWAEPVGREVRWVQALMLAAAVLAAIYVGETAALHRHKSRPDDVRPA
jgi:hypothetical protein